MTDFIVTEIYVDLLLVKCGLATKMQLTKSVLLYGTLRYILLEVSTVVHRVYVKHCFGVFMRKISLHGKFYKVEQD